MSSRLSLVPAIGVAAFLALLTGGSTYLASDRPLVGLIGLTGALVSGAAVLILLAEPGRAEAVSAAPGRGVSPVPPLVPPLVAPAESTGPLAPAGDVDRGNLVQACIYLRDRVTSTALATRLDQALRQVGVSTVDPTGERFDPSHHEAGGALPTTNDALVGTIAAVEAPGYADRGVLLRPPVVTVYQRRQT
jgi:hypothetical protein